eukprot:3406205-Pleurochrysis_carterae.AAC.1
MSLVGALLYCSTQMRPDVAYAVGMLCRAMSCPTSALLDDARRVLKYLYTFTAPSACATSPCNMTTCTDSPIPIGRRGTLRPAT